jgi:hypothetical protein
MHLATRQAALSCRARMSSRILGLDRSAGAPRLDPQLECQCAARARLIANGGGQRIRRSFCIVDGFGGRRSCSSGHQHAGGGLDAQTQEALIGFGVVDPRRITRSNSILDVDAVDPMKRSYST